MNSMSEFHEHDRVLLECGGGGELEHLLEDPSANRRKRAAEIHREFAERHRHERGRQELGFTADMRSRTRQPGEQPEIPARHDDVMVDGLGRIFEHRPAQVLAQAEVRFVTRRDHRQSGHVSLLPPSPGDR